VPHFAFESSSAAPKTKSGSAGTVRYSNRYGWCPVPWSIRPHAINGRNCSG
jgi:hypothetical protein